MLVLSRFRGESIIIGDEEQKVTVTVLKTVGNYVRLGIEAPRKIPVNRKEIHDLIQEQAKLESEKLDN